MDGEQICCGLLIAGLVIALASIPFWVGYNNLQKDKQYFDLLKQCGNDAICVKKIHWAYHPMAASQYYGACGDCGDKNDR